MILSHAGPLSPERVSADLGTRIVGREIVYYPAGGSTMDIAIEKAAHGAAEGLVVLTDEQTTGRGRHDRPWIAPAGSSVLASFLFRPALRADNGHYVAMAVALATLDAIRAVTGLEGVIKWPNDILLGQGKVGGLLTQSGLIGAEIDHLIVGLGLNVNFDPAQVAELPETASSLMLALGQPVDRHALVRALLRAVDSRYIGLRGGDSPVPEWSEKLSTLGQRVRVVQPTGAAVGTAESVDVHGNLIVRRDDGIRKTISAGDVVNLRSAD
jgi:BirA family biotin operon repressor/biotin-[acetyl-CoA-carboxylase] ligase